MLFLPNFLETIFSVINVHIEAINKAATITKIKLLLCETVYSVSSNFALA